MTISAAMYYSDFNHFQTSGYSPEAKIIQDKRKSIAERLFESVFLGVRKRDIINKSFENFNTVCKENWDGYDAISVDSETLFISLSFLMGLPENLPLPDLSADPDGSISMEWYRTPEWIFSISIEASGKIDYAGIFADKKVAGSCFFSGEIDKDIIGYIGKI